MAEEILAQHTFVFNPGDSGGEQLTLRTEIFDNGDAAAGLPGGIYTNQTLELMSYCNRARFDLVGATIGPEGLRQLANELEEALVKARARVEVRKENPFLKK